MSLLDANGTKRLVAAFLTALGAIVEILGGLGVGQVLQIGAGSFGAIGVTHALANKSFKRYFISSLASLLAIAQFIPQLAPYSNVIQMLQIATGSAAVGQKIGETKGNVIKQ